MNCTIFTLSTLTAKYSVMFAQKSLYLSLIALIGLGHVLITMAENAIAFKDAFIEGYEGLDGSFCSLYCDVSSDEVQEAGEVFEAIVEVSEKVLNPEIDSELNEMFEFETYSIDALKELCKQHKIKGANRIKTKETLIKKLHAAMT